MYSYGSGAASGMFRLRINDANKVLLGCGGSTSATEYLDGRKQLSPEEYMEMIEAFSNTYGKFDFAPTSSWPQREGVFYLAKVDEWGRREYLQKK